MKVALGEVAGIPEGGVKRVEFFGREGRIAHRIYGGVILNVVE